MASYLGGAGSYWDAVNKAVSASKKSHYLLPSRRFWLSSKLVCRALLCPWLQFWAYRAMTGASIATSIGAGVQECVVSENVIHLCSSAGGCQAVLLFYQLPSGEGSARTADRITAASHPNQKAKILVPCCAHCFPLESSHAEHYTCYMSKRYCSLLQ